MPPKMTELKPEWSSPEVKPVSEKQTPAEPTPVEHEPIELTPEEQKQVDRAVEQFDTALSNVSEQDMSTCPVDKMNNGDKLHAQDFERLIEWLEGRQELKLLRAKGTHLEEHGELGLEGSLYNLNGFSSEQMSKLLKRIDQLPTVQNVLYNKLDNQPQPTQPPTPMFAQQNTPAPAPSLTPFK